MVNRKSFSILFVWLIVTLFTLAFLFLLSAAAEAHYPSSDATAFQSDDFNACSLDTGLWTFVNPVGDGSLAMSGTHALISVPAGTDHDIWGTNPGNFKNNSARIMQPAENTSFTVEVKFDSGLSQLYQMQGVLIEEDENDLLRLEFYGDGVNTYMYAAKVVSGQISSIGNPWGLAIVGPGYTPLYMRVKREGDFWTQSFSFNNTVWYTHVTFTHAMTVTAVGTYAGNTTKDDTPGQQPAHTAIIDYFFNATSPITPEDGITNTITINRVGSGQVAKEPDKPNYICGEAVTLTATAEPWWGFQEWSGDLLGSINPATLTIAGPHVVTATFTQNDYTLTVKVNPVGSGAVAREPNLDHYHYGDVVTLTATANPGWTFAGWSGGLTSTNNPVTTTIAGHTTITATFTQNDYTLTVKVNPVGSGSVAREPNLDHYHYGDAVTLTATANPGWTFTGWSGGLSGTNNPARLTITRTIAVTATFAQGAYPLTIYTVGSGRVTVNPASGPYRYGDVVTLTAIPKPAWIFAGWSGDLISTANPVTTTITGSTTVTATFTSHQVFLPLVVRQYSQ